MFQFRNIFSISLIILVSCSTRSAVNSEPFSPISGELYSPSKFLEPFPESLLPGIAIDHKIIKRNAFETLRDLTSNSDTGDDTSGLIVNRRIYNSSIALTIPFFSFKIPHLLNGGFIVNEAIFGVFAWGITALVFGLSFIFTGSAPSDEQSRSFQRLSNQAKNSNFNFLGPDFSKSFGMDGMQCIQKVICQAHSPKEGKRYGIMATSIKTLFPVPKNDTLGASSSSPFQSAARAGKHANKICDNIYDCILDPLGSARYLIHWYSHKYENARFLLKLVDYDKQEKEGSFQDTVGTNSTTIYNNDSAEDV